MPDRVMKTDPELRELALGMTAGTIFTDRHIAQDDFPDMLPSVFLAFGLLDPTQRKELIDGGLAVIYEDMEKAGGHSVNGYPQFLSFQHLCRDEWDRLMPMLDEIMAWKNGEQENRNA